MIKLRVFCSVKANSRFLILAWWLVCFCATRTVGVLNVGLAAEEVPVLRIPGATAYVAPNPEGARVNEQGVQSWVGPEQKVLFFGEFANTGKVRVRLTVALPPDASSRLKISLGTQ